MAGKNRMSKRRISGLILSAGRSERMGSPKAFLRTKTGNTFIKTICNIFEEAEVERICVVANKENYFGVKKEIGRVAEIFINHRPEDGMLSSIRIGIEELKDSYATFIAPVDIPYLDKKVLTSMMNSEFEEDSILGIPVYNGRRGHPVLLLRRGYSLLTEDLPTGMKSLIQRYPRLVKEIHVDSNLPVDFDTPEDYERMAE